MQEFDYSENYSVVLVLLLLRILTNTQSSGIHVYMYSVYSTIKHYINRYYKLINKFRK